MNRVRALELEFDEPLADIVIGMREQACSWKTIAGALGISSRTLRRWRRKIGFSPIDSRNIVRENHFKPRMVDEIARRHGYNDFEDMYRDMRLSKKMTVAQMSEKTKICERTITKWTPRELKGTEIKTKKKIAAANKNLAKARAVANSTRSSPWFSKVTEGQL